ncbi:hypothetical protein F4804DRAFT_324059 [Jackrogersella minutella]|nr:hypothetical protein F4804DRAFT_324059 [Jackrogersella minutella]
MSSIWKSRSSSLSGLTLYVMLLLCPWLLFPLEFCGLLFCWVLILRLRLPPPLLLLLVKLEPFFSPPDILVDYGSLEKEFVYWETPWREYGVEMAVNRFMQCKEESVKSGNVVMDDFRMPCRKMRGQNLAFLVFL